ncbi:feruloyl-CoA synthase [Mesorhizobium sp. L-8-10]|uniref:feruloyl-CoA synthase n=1 Tax=Mesorhizobium sp. L-8-10 TaxID=2744523 RepID=UPI001925E43E|nr:feruloyl-CoA synthase [Mesorhizobium sp. L-8-10]BCH28185.1 feruloyl-CoA synthase [Mesorhizobium sp. L-8-10]
MRKDGANRLFAEVDVRRRDTGNGVTYLESGIALPQSVPCVGAWLERWASERPDATCVAERAGDGWRRVSYGEALRRVREIAGWLLHAGAGQDRPVAILSENSVDHWLMAFAAMHVGVPVATISTAYSLMSSDHEKLKAMIELVTPAVIMVSDAGRYGAALKAIEGRHAAVVVASAGASTTMVAFADAKASGRDSDVAERFAAITPDTTARLLFTSGSTGTPKAVINTHLMLTSNQEANGAVCPFLSETPPRIVDWLPWSHTFGANFTSNMLLRNGGELYIDEGKPAPGLIEHTIRNMIEIRPTMCFNVPRGYEMLLRAAETDADFREALFGVEFIFYAAAALPGSIWSRLIELSADTKGKATPMVAAWGSTETAPLATYCHFQAERTGNIGVPVPGTALKLLPNGGKLEVRVKGPQVTPGYFRNPEMTSRAFDAEGFYIMGDAVRFADPDDPARGLFFDGRVSEDFKLTSGTWVSVGELRIAGIDALSPVAQDIVVAGHDRDAVAFLIFPNEAACRNLAGLQEAPFGQVLDHPAVRGHVADGLKALKMSGGGSSRYAVRARFLASPPDPDRGEITDKGYINQRQTLANRQADLERLYGDDPDSFIFPAN